MNNQNFYLRLIALLLIIMAVFFYNGTVKDKEQAQDIADLTAKTESLEKQQEQLLTALKETYEEQKTAAESNASSDASSEADNKFEKDSAEDKENTDQADSEDADDSDNVYKNGTFEGSGTGYGGTITVQVTLEDDTITAVSVVSAPSEGVGYGVAVGVLSSAERPAQDVPSGIFQHGTFIHDFSLPSAGAGNTPWF